MVITQKVNELDEIELTADLPEYDFKKGDRVTLIAVFDNPEAAYDLKLVDAFGQSRFAYSVKSAQIKTLTETAKIAF